MNLALKGYMSNSQLNGLKKNLLSFLQDCWNEQEKRDWYFSTKLTTGEFGKYEIRSKNYI